MLSLAKNERELDSLAATRLELDAAGEGEDWALAEAAASIIAAPRRLVSLTSGVERKSDISDLINESDFLFPGIMLCSPVKA
jgi:hypothetical protein